ncbi:polysaccharide lyase [Azospirillum sp.]|uniref:polysaccharide lyase n=1 Tax=Azospirillum sp. TaxID=34012 RepID=UPI002D4FDE05|nr:polysaccharide lyase [Azospirillum sp.]HYD68338.1 polysaccharide lyase [Azospirillum sp.]
MASTLFEAVFDNPLTSGLNLIREGEPVSTVSVDGRTALKSELSRSDDSVRSEVVPAGMDDSAFTAAGSQTANAKLGHTYEYEAKILIPEGWQEDSTPEILMQWHDFPDSGEAWKNPAAALQIRPWSDGESHFVLETHADASRITPSGGSGRYDSKETFDLGKVEDAVGEWTDWKFKIKWGYTDDSGSMEVWRDGKRLVNEDMATAFNDEHGPYWKLGVYKWAWSDGRDTGADSRTYYYDDIRIKADGENRSADAPAEALPPSAAETDTLSFDAFTDDGTAGVADGEDAVPLAGVPPVLPIDQQAMMLA